MNSCTTVLPLITLNWLIGGYLKANYPVAYANGVPGTLFLHHEPNVLVFLLTLLWNHLNEMGSQVVSLLLEVSISLLGVLFDTGIGSKCDCDEDLLTPSPIFLVDLNFSPRWPATTAVVG
jgi:hypothetical protein